MQYMAVYKKLLTLVKQAKISEFPASTFVIQEDALERIGDAENEDEVFAYGLYSGQSRDDALGFEVMISREGFGVNCGGLLFGSDFSDYKTEQAAAQALFTTCQLLLNGQLRVLVTVGRKGALGAELFLVQGSKSEPVMLDLQTRKLMFTAKRTLHAHVLQNRIALGVVQVPADFYLHNKVLTKLYTEGGRTIDWAEPLPLDSKTLEKLDEEATWHETSKKSHENTYIFALKQWETWVFTVACGALFIGLSIIIPDSRVLFQALGFFAFVAFVVYVLPSLVKRKEARKQARRKSSAHSSAKDA